MDSNRLSVSFINKHVDNVLFFFFNIFIVRLFFSFFCFVFVFHFNRLSQRSNWWAVNSKCQVAFDFFSKENVMGRRKNNGFYLSRDNWSEVVVV